MTIAIQVLITVIIGALLALGATFALVQSQSALPAQSDTSVESGR